jgi:phage-related baseplate assembly protein
LSAHPDIIQAVVYSAPEIAGEVWIFPLLRGGLLPTPEILAAVLAKCNPNTVRPVSDFVSVFAPTPFVYTLRMHYWVSTSTEVLLSTIQNGVTQAVADWILWQRSYVSRDLNCDELIRRVIEAGAKRVVIDLPSPTFQVMAYNQLACHDDTVPPDIRFEGLEDP